MASPTPLGPGSIPAIVQQAGLVNFTASYEQGQLTVCGTNSSGHQVRISSYQGNGLTEGTMSTFQPGSRDARQAEAMRLRSIGLTQLEIANRLGVSQKTISNDLR